MKLLITRHGQAEDNVAGITMGQRDSALTPLGVEQAHNKALALKRLPIKLIVSMLQTSVDACKLQRLSRTNLAP